MPGLDPGIHAKVLRGLSVRRVGGDKSSLNFFFQCVNPRHPSEGWDPVLLPHLVSTSLDSSLRWNDELGVLIGPAFPLRRRLCMDCRIKSGNDE